MFDKFINMIIVLIPFYMITTYAAFIKKFFITRFCHISIDLLKITFNVYQNQIDVVIFR